MFSNQRKEGMFVGARNTISLLSSIIAPKPFQNWLFIFGIFIEIGIVSVELWSTRDHSGVHKHACFYCFYFLEWLLCASPLVQLFY